jgi:hypothetical protein
MYAFWFGFPGWICCRSTPCRSHRPVSARDTSSGPLSQRIAGGRAVQRRPRKVGDPTGPHDRQPVLDHDRYHLPLRGRRRSKRKAYGVAQAGCGCDMPVTTRVYGSRVAPSHPKSPRTGVKKT